VDQVYFEPAGLVEEASAGAAALPLSSLKSDHVGLVVAGELAAGAARAPEALATELRFAALS